jgi:hypothetical protein
VLPALELHIKKINKKGQRENTKKSKKDGRKKIC